MFKLNAGYILGCPKILEKYVTTTIIELRHEKTNILVFDLVRHKPGCTATEDGYRLEISDLESREIALSI